MRALRLSALLVVCLGCYESTHVETTHPPSHDAGVIWRDAAPRDTCGLYREVCNGLDDDCDGATDEGTPEELGCREGEGCYGLCFAG